MFSRFIPWRWFLRRLALRHGFFDPFDFIARIRQFSQPSEVQEPIELLRAGAKFHARGLINTKAIQHNLDWVWPYWVNRQFNPEDPSFIPRAFSFSHVNLTQRNWTAVGLPQTDVYPIVDPRGMVTPVFDGWSIDLWLMGPDGRMLFPSREKEVFQKADFEGGLAVITEATGAVGRLVSRVEMDIVENTPRLILSVSAEGAPGTRLIVALRPFNPEGVYFIDAIRSEDKQLVVSAEKEQQIYLSAPADEVLTSNYSHGDVAHNLTEKECPSHNVSCSVGMATGGLIYNLGESGSRALKLEIPYGEADYSPRVVLRHTNARDAWSDALKPAACMRIPDTHMQGLYDNAVRTLLLLSADDVLPGPYTYKRFWFRDACLMLNSILALGLKDRAEQQIARFPGRQRRNGYFHSQEGEWDSNGQVLWIMDRYGRLTGDTLPDSWLYAMEKGADWILRKCRGGKRAPGAEGLLPAGFSAEHLGPNDYYYWDNFWALQGLYSVIRQEKAAGRIEDVKIRQGEVATFEKAVWGSIENSKAMLKDGAIAAAPGRRMDAGAVGSMVADYPLQLTDPGDPRIRNTLQFLLKQCTFRDGFFQDMIHSGINAYLTLALAQTLLRMDDDRYRTLIQSVAKMASPTGNWPEAIHPQTMGGCMGDGQHGWAAAEWILMMRNLFVREEGNTLVLCSGLFPEWYECGEEIAFGPTLTPWGDVSVSAVVRENGLEVEVSGDLREKPEVICIQPPGCEHSQIDALNKCVFTRWKDG